MSESPPSFTPVPVRARRDGWTPERQRAFIAALAATRCVAAAARSIGLSFQTAYRLRARPDAASFAAAWDAALAAPPLDADFAGRAIGGVATPIRYRGKVMGERRRYDDRLAMHLLAIRRPERYGAARPERQDPTSAFIAALTALQADLDPPPLTSQPALSGRIRGPAPKADLNSGFRREGKISPATYRPLPHLPRSRVDKRPPHPDERPRWRSPPFCSRSPPASSAGR